MQENNSTILIYQTEDGTTKIETRLSDETVWLSQAQLCELFQKSKSSISEHLKHIFDEGELNEVSVVRKFRTTANDGKAYETMYYNLDVIISVGYRVKSHRGTQFRIWATQRLKEYIIKGFALNDELLKAGGKGNYFEELLARIRDIRSSEKVFWRKILDIYATMYMQDWVARLNDFLKMTGKEILNYAGTISHQQAIDKAKTEFEKYNEQTKNELSSIERDFIKRIENTTKKLRKNRIEPHT